ncbi:MAG: hypothetical protein CMM59_16975 [Rhodospirillaceae bacterium]|nr:hypothetical protein [Rhodospirillaceae bacterium]|tara:strand:+ start:2196 stop:3281 length:1086 start_codon:yes stop_codon:yes gene_type:complete
MRECLLQVFDWSYVVPIYRLNGETAEPVEETTFQAESIMERRDLQAMFRNAIEIIVPNAMVLAEEFGDWEESRRRIDLLCLDREARIVVVELKRTDDGGHMELQAVRYAAMVSHMTFAAAVRAHEEFLSSNNVEDDAERRILEFLGWDEPQPDEFGSDILIVLASAEFSKELTTAVMWLGEHDIDIRCVRLKPYKLGTDVLLDVQQIYPLPEAADYQVRLREKDREERRARSQNRDLTRFNLTIGGRVYENLPKRHLAYYVIREGIERGAEPLEVYPEGRRWLIVPGEYTESEFLAAAENERDEISSTSESRRFFTADDELIKYQGKTYAITKMWGNQTLSEVDRIIEQFQLKDISYRPQA